ncbi:putative monocarboxylate transporter mch1 [Podospora bellae-mahoneyi]|uniref:Probable transporter MCH1 n=1 Tax=Podospora bellae-mahoneyi TaxID=2093777 RepID=A0ABR0F9A1_9PEZI|nr:putative monocarboxylate transporter mch1 [Podospora bellae-mahoneyi]
MSSTTTPLLHRIPSTSTLGPASSDTTSLRSLPSSRYRRRPRPTATRRALLLSFLSSLLSSLSAGSITIFSLYAPTFQSTLHYSQYRINGLASAASIAMYMPVSLLGYYCDRVGPAPLSLLSAVFFGLGYAGAALFFYWGQQGDPEGVYWGLVGSFVGIGVGTCSMYLSAVATCAKNFGRGRHRGLALAVPIAAFGLSGMWLSQVGDRLFSLDTPGDLGGKKVDVVRFFGFLAILLVIVGVVGAVGLRIVDEQELIEEAVEELERSGILDGSRMLGNGVTREGYGGVDVDEEREEEDMIGAGILDPRKDQEEDKKIKTWVLNAETRRFLTDHTMWLFAFGFFFMIGPGEAFINNMGTVIKTLYDPELRVAGGGAGEHETSAATHVSIVGITSTIVRLLTGTLTDLLAPSPQAGHVQIASSTELERKRFSVSRVVFLLCFAVMLSLGLAGLAAGWVQDHGERFWVISGLVGAGYGAVFSLTPIIITVIWGVENFATNWGIVAMFPALGATMWGLVYSAVYQEGARRQSVVGGEDGGDNLCYGVECYASAFWAMAGSVWVACGLVLWAWKGRGGWSQRGVVV